MKKSILLLSCIVGLQAFAATDIVPGTPYYMRNVSNGKFFTAGGWWGTHAIVGETGLPVTFDHLTPVLAGSIPLEIYPLVSRICGEQELISEGIARRDVNMIFAAFANDPLVTCSLADAHKLFAEMCRNTEKYLSMYDLRNC